MHCARSIHDSGMTMLEYPRLMGKKLPFREGFPIWLIIRQNIRAVFSAVATNRFIDMLQRRAHATPLSVQSASHVETWPDYPPSV